MSKSSHPDEGAYGPWIQAQRRGKRKLSTTSKPKTGATPANKTGPGTGAGEGGSRFSILTDFIPLLVLWILLPLLNQLTLLIASRVDANRSL
uniref:Uncharacterized protein n=1 Tax=Picea glauca TaxID=3330 RepID=A0A101LUE4_PICGL|nr:hypothetical protein ABT39_MTgene2646 [Picea glauca]QHR88091.1 hypothetical protein Q903MT_gene2104 [Picea sitchensis]